MSLRRTRQHDRIRLVSAWITTHTSVKLSGVDVDVELSSILCINQLCSKLSAKIICGHGILELRRAAVAVAVGLVRALARLPFAQSYFGGHLAVQLFVDQYLHDWSEECSAQGSLSTAPAPLDAEYQRPLDAETTLS